MAVCAFNIFLLSQQKEWTSSMANLIFCNAAVLACLLESLVHFSIYIYSIMNFFKVYSLHWALQSTKILFLCAKYSILHTEWEISGFYTFFYWHWHWFCQKWEYMKINRLPRMCEPVASFALHFCAIPSTILECASPWRSSTSCG